ncbi:hypothetical protein [Methylosarcina fibrata]|uniref:hypothetical protein n=1 Tax=Methylosarcina fibrata TaxID=105972 RepID=UPI000373C246|nr:hypothetical protein [Methylosarcina fibrata]
MKKRDAVSLFRALLTLSEAQQAEIETELQQIDGMACQGNIIALIEENVRRTFGMANITTAHCLPE